MGDLFGASDSRNWIFCLLKYRTSSGPPVSLRLVQFSKQASGKLYSAICSIVACYFDATTNPYSNVLLLLSLPLTLVPCSVYLQLARHPILSRPGQLITMRRVALTPPAWSTF